MKLLRIISCLSSAYQHAYQLFLEAVYRAVQKAAKLPFFAAVSTAGSGVAASRALPHARLSGTGRVNLTTLHSSKGREFDAVILYGINGSELPDNRDRRSQSSLREARRLFYVGVTRPRKQLCLVFQERRNSPWVLARSDLIERVLFLCRRMIAYA